MQVHISYDRLHASKQIAPNTHLSVSIVCFSSFEPVHFCVFVSGSFSIYSSISLTISLTLLVCLDEFWFCTQSPLFFRTILILFGSCLFLQPVLKCMQVCNMSERTSERAKAILFPTTSFKQCAFYSGVLLRSIVLALKPQPIEFSLYHERCFDKLYAHAIPRFQCSSARNSIQIVHGM